MDIKLVQDSYANMSNDELVFLVTKDARELTPEALEIARNELKKRGLDSRLSDALTAQNTTYTGEELDRYCELINGLDCPKCGSNASRLNATLTAEVMSFLFITQYRKKIRVACPDCLIKLNNAAMAKTMLLGWWGFPWGIIRSIEAIAMNVKNKRRSRMDIPNEFMRSFALYNIGLLEANKGDKVKLGAVISETLA